MSTEVLARVFVYGSLKRGFYNHGVLDDAELLGTARTADAAFAMFNVGRYPAVRHTAERPIAVHGEVYAVSPNILADLDRLEGHPEYYTRQQVEIEGHGPCWMYLINQIMPAPRVESGIWEREHGG